MTAFNDTVRGALRLGLPLAAWWARRDFARRIERFPDAQSALRSTYGITPDTPIAGYDAATRVRVEALAAQPGVALAYTSGTTGEPKALAYPPSRLRSFKADSQAVGVQAWHRLHIRGAAFFIFGGLTADRSFATLVLHRGEPSRVTSLLEPARHLSTPAMAQAIRDHGATAARLWLMLLSDPGMVYSTNPSTLAVFLSELQADWAGVTSLARAWVGGLDADPGLARVAARVAASGAPERMRRAAESSELPPLHELLPGLSAYCCWDGGYVTGFLKQIQAALPPARFTHVPMYAMSTETIETLPWFDDDGAMRFLPLAPGVLYELLPEGAPDDPGLLLAPTDAVAGEAYTLVVSDPYGLRRYQTEDVFRCHGLVRGLPDLRFERRRGLTWSFTGEKLTGEQVAAVFAALEASHPRLAALSAQLTLLPSWPEGDDLPRYRLVVAHPSAAVHAPPDLERLARELDAGLAALNDEYAGKRSTGRLAAPTAHLLPYDRLAAALDARRVGADQGAGRGWESQFKLMPLTRVRWEETGIAL